MVHKQSTVGKIFRYVLLAIGCLVMIYPLIWMFFATFKTPDEIFSSTKLFPQTFNLSSYTEGWKGSGEVTFTTFFINTLKIVCPCVFFTVFSCMIVAYGFARYKFVGKKIFFTIMIGTLMLPDSVIIVPRYLLFNRLGWLNTYLPFIVPAILACYPFFIFMMVQFLRGIPRTLDEAAEIDGCGPVRILFQILLPLMKPALFSAALFQLIWTWNDFFNPLIMINSVKKYPLSLGLRMSIDSAGAQVAWNEIMAMSLLTVLPLTIIFFLAQKYFVEGISTSGIKG